MKNNLNPFSLSRITLSVILLALVLLLSGCSGNSLAGEASRQGYVDREGWLVAELSQTKGELKVENIYFQQYNKTQKEFFDKVLSKTAPEKRNFNRQLLFRGDFGERGEYFSDQERIISENFKGEINLTDYSTRPKNKTIVKIPLTGKIDLNKPWEISVKRLDNNKERKLVNKKQSIGWREKLKKEISQWSPTCDYLKEIIPGHNDDNDENRINLIFMGYGYPEKDIFSESLPYYLDLNGKGVLGEYMHENDPSITFNKTFRGLFYFIPFEKNHNKFNFWYTDEIFPLEENPTDYCYCVPYTTTSLFEECGFKNYKVIALCYKQCASDATVDGKLTQVFTAPASYMPNYKLKNDPSFSPDSVETFVHEFGHLFGGLVDEYYSESLSDVPNYPNCAPSIEMGFDWWKDIFPNINTYNGCSYAENNFRFSKKSIMLSALTTSEEYGKESFREVNQFYLCYKIFQNYGSVGGEFCSDFFDGSYTPPKEICDDGKDNDGDDITDCLDKDCIGSCPEICDNPFHEDEDGDGLTDCWDNDCAGKNCKEGCLCSPTELGKKIETNCGDFTDNDDDDLPNCADSDCTGKLGNMGHGKISFCCQTVDDCYKADEMGTFQCINYMCISNPSCEDQLVQGNNDQYCATFGYYKCASFEGKKICVSSETCNNQIDEDFDYAIDCTDADCKNSSWCN